MKEEEVSTTVGSGVHLTGVLKDQSDIVVHGTVDGEVNSDQNIVIGDNAKVKGPVSAQIVNISGEVKGMVTAKEKLEIHPTGKVDGNIKTKDLIIHSGAKFNGKSEMTDESAAGDSPMIDLDEVGESSEDGKDTPEDEEGGKIEIEK